MKILEETIIDAANNDDRGYDELMKFKAELRKIPWIEEGVND